MGVGEGGGRGTKLLSSEIARSNQYQLLKVLNGRNILFILTPCYIHCSRLEVLCNSGIPMSVGRCELTHFESDKLKVTKGTR